MFVLVCHVILLLLSCDVCVGMLCLQPSERGVVHLRGARLTTPISQLYYSDVPLGLTMVSSGSLTAAVKPLLMNPSLAKISISATLV